jgi:uncharacterized protein (DUF1015 family)
MRLRSRTSGGGDQRTGGVTGRNGSAHRRRTIRAPVPTVRPFRALRYSPEVVSDLGSVMAPPYDVIGPEQHRRLLARDPRNVVRLDLPQSEPGDADPDERYRRAARLLRAWRADGTLRRDPGPALYPYEQTFRLPGQSGGEALVRRGLFARLVLEPFGAGSGVRPHERTLTGPKEDRYRLLRATAVNTSPVVGMYEDPSGEVPRWIADVTSTGAPAIDVMDDDEVRHRLWAIPIDATDGGAGTGLLARIAAGPITIADGHHRYETALRFRDEQRRGIAPSGSPEPAAWDEILVLLLEPVAGPIVVLPTHRVVRALGDDGVARLRDRLPSLFEVMHGVPREQLPIAFALGETVAGGAGRFGLWARDGGAILQARRDAFEPLLPSGGTALRRLDVSLLGVALDRLAGIDPAAVDAGARIAYTKDAAEAIRWVDERHDGADAAFLLDPTPAADIAAVAADGDVMPQKSTYIYPKALTGLVINPLD